MGLTVSELDRFSVGNKKCVIADITFDSSYPSGGESLTPDDIGMGTFSLVQPTPAGGYAFEYDYSNETLIAYGGGGVVAHTHDLKIIGGQAAAGTDTLQGAAADSILGKEEATDVTIAGADVATKGGVVAATATLAGAAEPVGEDLSAVTCRVMFWGV